MFLNVFVNFIHPPFKICPTVIKAILKKYSLIEREESIKINRHQYQGCKIAQLNLMKNV